MSDTVPVNEVLPTRSDLRAQSLQRKEDTREATSPTIPSSSGWRPYNLPEAIPSRGVAPQGDIGPSLGSDPTDLTSKIVGSGPTRADLRMYNNIQEFSTRMSTLGVTIDTDEEIAKYNLARFLSPRVGVSISHAYLNSDQVLSSYYGAVAPPKSAWKSVADEWRTAVLSVRGSHMASQLAMLDHEGDAFDTQFDLYMDTLSQIPTFDQSNRPLWVQGLKAAAAFGPSILASTVAGIGGALVGTAVGAPMVGARVASAFESFVLASGGIFGDILTTGVTNQMGKEVPLWEYIQETLPPEQAREAKKQAVWVARAAASAGGVLSAAIEMAQLDALTGGALFADSIQHASSSILRELIQSGKLAKGAAAFAVAHAGNVVENVVQEFAQETVEWASAELTTRFIEEAQSLGIPQRSIEEYAQEMQEVVKTAAMGSFLIGIPGSGRAARTATQTKPGFSIQEEAKSIPTTLLSPHEGEVSEVEKATVRKEFSQGNASPINVYVDEDGTYRPSDRRAQAAMSVINEVELEEVPVFVTDKPQDISTVLSEEPVVEENIDDDLLDDEEIDYDEQEVVEAFDEESDAPDVDPSTVTSAQAGIREASDEEKKVATEKRWRRAKVQGKLAREWKRQAKEAGGFTTSTVNSLEQIAQRVADYLEMDIDEFIDAAFQPSAFVKDSSMKAGTKGQADINTSGKNQILFSDTADTSTLVHEFAHVMRGYVKKEHLAVLQQQYGNEFWSGGRITEGQRKAEEQFAKDFEQYLLEGVAPTRELKGVFSRLSKLLKDIYGVVKSNLSPEVRGVFNQMLGMDSELEGMQSDLQTARLSFDKELKAKRKELRKVAEQNRLDDKYQEELQKAVEEDKLTLNQSEEIWNESLGDIFKTTQDPALDIIRTATYGTREELGDLREELGLDREGKTPVHIVHKMLSAMTRDAHGLNLKDGSEESKEFFARALAGEASWAIDNAKKDAIGWYNKTLNKAMAKYSEKFPELADDPGSQIAFKLSLAITSQGLDVHENSKTALTAYKGFRKNGKFSEKIGSGTSAPAMRSNFRQINELFELYDGDWELLEKFLTDYYTITQLEALGYKPGGENKGTLTPGSAILGPKIGAGFFSNLFGNFDPLTMDLWFMRSVSRWMGDAGDVVSEKTKKANRESIKTRIKAFTAKEPLLKGISRSDTGVMVRTFDTPYTKSALLKDPALLDAWMEEVRLGINFVGGKLTKMGVKKPYDLAKTSLTKDVKNYAEYATATRAIPKGGTERNFFRDIVNQARSLLTQNGYHGITPADLQAVLWFFEKDVYTALGAADKKAESADYYDAAKENIENEQSNTRRDADQSRGRSRRDGGYEKGKEGDSQGITDWDSRLAPPTDQSYPEGTSGSYTRRNIKRAGALFVTGDTAVPIAAYTPNPAFSIFSENILSKLDDQTQTIKAPGTTPHTFLELDPTTSAPAFHGAISHAVETQGDLGFMVDIKDVGTYTKLRLFTTEDGTAGFALDKETGDIVSVFKARKQGPDAAANMMIPLAIQAGGRRLDCFDTVLPFIYGQFGFVDVGRDHFSEDPDIVPTGWNYKHPAITEYSPDGKPDVVFMALPNTVSDHGWLGYENMKDFRSGRKQKRGTYDGVHKSEYLENYDAGAPAQDEKIDGGVTFNQEVNPAHFSAPLESDKVAENKRKWFRESVVVDEGGRPLEVYHAGPQSIGDFDPAYTNPEASYGQALYFSEAIEDVVENYTKEDGPDIAHKISNREAEILSDVLDYPENYNHNPYAQEMYLSEEEASELPADSVMDFWIQSNGQRVANYIAKREILGGRNVHPVILRIEKPYDEAEQIAIHPDDTQSPQFAEILLAAEALGYSEEMVFELWEDIMGDFAEQNISLYVLKNRAVNVLYKYEMETEELFGTTAAPEGFRQILEHVGYDGVIQYPQNYHWGEWTLAEKHFLPFTGYQVKSSFNRGTYNLNSSAIFDQSADHEKEVKRAVRDGRPIADNVIKDYKDRSWAIKELKRRKTLREDFSWLGDMADAAEKWEDLKAIVEEFYGKELPDEKTPNDLFYKKAFNFFNAPSTQEGNKAFLSSIQSTQATREFISELSKGYKQLQGLNLHPTVLRAARRGVIGSTSGVDVIQSLIASRPEVYRKAQALVRDDKTALENLAYERETSILEADAASRTSASPSTRMSVAAKVNDPELRKLALSGEATGRELKSLGKEHYKAKEKLELEVAKAKGEVAKAKEGTARKEKSIARLKEKEARRIQNNKTRADVKKLLAYRSKLAHKIARKIPKSVDLSARMMIESITEGFSAKNITEKTKTKRADLLQALNSDPALKATMRPTELKKLSEKSLSDWTTKELEEMAHRTQTLINIGKRIKADKDGKRKADIEDVATSGVLDVSGQQRAEDISGIGSKEAEALRKGETKNPASAPWGSVKKGTLRPPRVFRMLFGEASKMYEWFVTKVNLATDESLKRTAQRQESIKAKMVELGIKESSLALDETVDGMTYTYDQIIHMYIGMKNEKSKKAIIEGNSINQHQVDQFIAHLSEEQKAYGDALLKDFDDHYIRLRDAYRASFNEDLGNEDNYFPMLRLGVLHENLEEELQDQHKTRSAWISKGFTKSRINIADEHQAAIQLGVSSIWASQVEKQEHFISSAQLVKDLHAIRNNKELQSGIKNTHGDKWNKWLEKYVNDFASPHIYKALDGAGVMFAKIRGNYALGALSWNALTVFKQIPSITLFLARVGPIKLMASATEFVYNGKAMVDFANQTDPQMYARSMERYLEELKEREKYGKLSPAMKLIKMGMKPIQLFDKGVTTIGWNAVYKDHLSRGFTESQAASAAQMAVLETQPSGRAKDLAEIYRGNEAQNWFTMFSNQINQIWNIGVADLPTAVKNGQYQQAMGIVTGLLINFSVMMLATGWRRPEDLEDLPKDLSFQIIRQMMNMIPLIGSAMYGASGEYGYSGINPFPMGEAIGSMTAYAFKDDKSKGDFMQAFKPFTMDIMLQLGLPAVLAGRLVKATAEIGEDDYLDALGQLFGPAFKEEIARNE